MLAAPAPSQGSEPMWGALIAIGILGFIWWAWRDDRNQKKAQQARLNTERRELERLHELYPDVAERDLRCHHEQVLAQQRRERQAIERAARQEEFERRLSSCGSTSEMRDIAREFGDSSINRREVLRRSNWRCGICGGGIRRSFAWDPHDDRCGTIDHIRPISRGGQHEWWNVQAAHWGCNKNKGASW